MAGAESISTGRPEFDSHPARTICNGSSTRLEDFFAGDPTGGTILVGNTNRAMTWTANALFAQDDWRITPKVTINLGMRWTYQSPISAGNNLWANFDPTTHRLGWFSRVHPGTIRCGNLITAISLHA